MKETQKPRYTAVPFGDAKHIEDGEELLLADAEAVSEVHGAAAGHPRSCRWVRRALRAALLALAAIAVLHLVFCGTETCSQRRILELCGLESGSPAPAPHHHNTIITARE